MSAPDAAPGSAAPPAFDDCAETLLEQGLLLSPAELHGAVCGLRGGGFSAGAEAALAALEQTLALPLQAGAAQCGIELYRAAESLFAPEDGAFLPLLPDDDLELAQRVAALAAWCRGFLGGYAQARVSAGSAQEPVAADSAEALRDFAAMAQAGMDDDEDGGAPEDVESAERHYAELVEYLRVAALSVAADSAAAAARGADARP